MKHDESYFIHCSKGFVAIDANSGGYPYYTTHLGSVHFFSSSKEAEGYRATCHGDENWTVYKADLRGNPVE